MIFSSDTWDTSYLYNSYFPRINLALLPLIIEGTSNIHDWKMTSDKGQLKIQFQPDAAGNIFRVNFSEPASTIKSESKVMDRMLTRL